MKKNCCSEVNFLILQRFSRYNVLCIWKYGNVLTVYSKSVKRPPYSLFNIPIPNIPFMIIYWKQENIPLVKWKMQGILGTSKLRAQILNALN